MSESSHEVGSPPPKRQFTIRGLLVLMLLVSIAAAGFSGLLRAEEDSPAMFVLFVVAAPLALLLLASIARLIESFIAARRWRRD
jgi:hypothetical protein